MSIAIVTDSTAYLSDEEINKYNINVIPINVIFGSDVYEEGVNLTNKEFYKKMEDSANLPSTSQPATGKLIEMYDKLADEGYSTVISIHLTDTISGFYKQVESISTMTNNIKIIPFNSGLTVRPMADLAIYAAKLVKEKYSEDEIINKLINFRKTIDELFIVDDLNNLVKGGRLSNASAFVGNLLNIKPILTFDAETNKIVAIDKVRSKKRAFKYLENKFKEDLTNANYPIKATVIDGNATEEADKWKEKLEIDFPDVEFYRSYIGPVIGTHLGSGAIALSWTKDFEK
ncbi:DegV family EDD domain-containing protein [Lactobacillus sp. S2-2]|uniref:DegV family protein n=1 Tax=Lactobacillus sp. S2-2 TaxID=2692917 RepID=UPI001F47E11E|nr:DegV family protein [Lactobacillus sp. S2-2]MCF6515053.1 DegV family EDD domain-containing protein [Lactobacillus sp. S2-2]